MTIDPRQLFPAHLGEVRDVARLAGGLSGAEVHAVTTATSKYVLRSPRAAIFALAGARPATLAPRRGGARTSANHGAAGA